MFFVYFRVSLRVHGSAYRLVFTKSLQSLAGQSCDREIDEFSYSAFINPAPSTESFDQFGRRMMLLQRSKSGNRTRVTQPELTLFRAPYSLDQHSCPMLVAVIMVVVNMLMLFNGKDHGGGGVLVVMMMVLVWLYKHYDGEN